MEKGGYVYILGSLSHVLYVGVTNKLERRLTEHKQGIGDGFTKQYNVTRLLWYERYDDIETAIAREKQLKGWRRDKKIRLIEKENPNFDDLSNEWYANRKL